MSFWTWLRGLRRCSCCHRIIPKSSAWIGMNSFGDYLCAECGPGQGCYAILEWHKPERWVHHGKPV